MRKIVQCIFALLLVLSAVPGCAWQGADAEMPIGPITPGVPVVVTADVLPPAVTSITAPTATMPVVSADLQALSLTVMNIKERSLDRVDGHVTGTVTVDNGGKIQCVSGSVLESDVGSQVGLDGAIFLGLNVASSILVGNGFTNAAGAIVNNGSQTQNGAVVHNGTTRLNGATIQAGNVELDGIVTNTGAGRTRKRIINSSNSSINTDRTIAVSQADIVEVDSLSADRAYDMLTTSAAAGDEIEFTAWFMLGGHTLTIWNSTHTSIITTLTTGQYVKLMLTPGGTQFQIVVKVV